MGWQVSRLHVEYQPLSWRERLIEGPHGYRLKSVSVGRRVWGDQIGKAIYRIGSRPDGQALELWDVRTNVLISSFHTQDGYDSPWGGDNYQRLVQVAERHEGHALNNALDARWEAQQEAWDEACKYMAEDTRESK